MLKVPSLYCIVSGGQTGADQGGLFAAEALEMVTGGYAPKGWRTEDGPAPWLETYGLIESDSEDYRPRTRANVAGSDATVIFGHRSPGSNLTEEQCRLLEKPCVWVQLAGMNPLHLRLWLIRHKVAVLNVAGNRESKNQGIQELTKDFLIKVLK